MPSSPDGLVKIFDDQATIAGVLGAAGITVESDSGATSSSLSALAVGIWYAYLNEAARLLEQDYASRDDIDAAMRFGCGYPTGPLAQLDEIGLDKVADVLSALYAASGDSRHRASSAITDRVTAGQLGKTSGAGFYSYSNEAGGDESVASDSQRDLRPIATVGVVGTGTMATGIIEVFARAGLTVVYVARSDEKVAAVRGALKKSLARAVAKGRLSEDGASEILARISGVTQRADLASVDLVVEAIVEDLETKLELFRELDSVCKPGAILATTTSSLSIDVLAASTSRPADVIGMHFFNPAPVMKLVEVVTGKHTDAQVTDTVVDMCLKIKKHPVLCGDRAGFIVNFLLFPYLNDAVRAVDAELVSVDELNDVMKEWLGLPMGPFSLLDVVGNDVSLAIEETIVKEFPDPCYAPATGLREVVARGDLGRKTGAGFLTY